MGTPVRLKILLLFLRICFLNLSFPFTANRRFETVSDPSVALAAHLGVYITPKSLTAFAGHPSWYSNGMSQPAVFVVDKKGRVVFKWVRNPFFRLEILLQRPNWRFYCSRLSSLLR
jgi:hypothetical protein